MNPYALAERYIGIAEIGAPGQDHPLVVWWLSLCGLPNSPDETPWCSAFVNGMAWELRLPRSKSAAARSWLTVGTPVETSQAQRGDVVILQRGAVPQPDASVLNAPGHVGFFSSYANGRLFLLGGNQGNGVSIAPFAPGMILGVRRLAT